MIPLFSGTVPYSIRNKTINRSFLLEEVKLAVRKLINNIANGADNVMNTFVKHCHNYCIQIIVDFLNIALNTEFIRTVLLLGISHPLYKNKGSVSDPDNNMCITIAL